MEFNNFILPQIFFYLN